VFLVATIVFPCLNRRSTIGRHESRFKNRPVQLIFDSRDLLPSSQKGELTAWFDLAAESPPAASK